MKSKKGFLCMACVLVLALVAVPTPQASSVVATPPPADEGDPVELRLEAVVTDSTTLGLDNAPDAPEATVSLKLDDGSGETGLGVGGTKEFLFLNRFTPDPGLFPFELNEIRVGFPGSSGVGVGDEIYLVVYEDADGNPANGTTFRAQYSATIAGLDSWSVYDLSTPLTMTDVGDVLIGVIARETPGSAYFPAALDTTTTQQRSWVGLWSTSPPPYPPTLPPDDTFDLIDNAGYPGNWLIRAYGETAVTGALSVYLPLVLNSQPCPPFRAGTYEGDASFSVPDDRTRVTSFALEIDALISGTVRAEELPIVNCGIENTWRLDFPGGSSIWVSMEGVFISETQIEGSYTVRTGLQSETRGWSSSWVSALSSWISGQTFRQLSPTAPE
jgi:hypothetical protein